MKSLYKKVIIKSLKKARLGQLNLSLTDGDSIVCGQPDGKKIQNLYVHSDAFFNELAHKGGIGLGEAYQERFWSSDDLTGTLEWLLINSKYIAPSTSPYFASLIRKVNSIATGLLHHRNRNNVEGSRNNIHAHYDLGNRFYQTFLDPSLTYSSGYFESSETQLEEAQAEKYDRLCRKLGIDSTSHILEIGCGWGGFAIYAAKHYDCCITGTTISKEQFDRATQRVKDEGLEHRIDITMTDYRKLQGTYDRIVSIEMLEAVGQEFLGEYFKQIEALLEPNGLAGIQVITCPNPLYEAYKDRVDWIQKHIFPGSHLPSTHALLENAEKSGQLDLYHMESFGLHYARTLREWRNRFLDQWDEIEKMGFDDFFKRKWEYYLAYCEAGFLQRHVNVCQLVFGRADETAYQFEQKQNTSRLERPELTQAI